MKTRCISFVVLLFVLTADLGAQTSNTVPIAVVTIGGPRRTLANNIASLLTVDLSSQPGFVLVDRNQLDKVLAEQALGRSGNVTPETAARIGRLTGAKILVTGREFNASPTSGEVVVVGNVIGTETGRVYSHTVQGATTNLVNLVSSLSQKIIGTIHDQSTNLLSTSLDSQAQRTDAIAADLKGKIPTVSIHITERVGNVQSTSRIAELELANVLRKAGVEMVNENAGQMADVMIVGDGVTSKAVPEGKSFSCRASVQIKAQMRVSGEILALDLQPAAAVDSSEEAVSLKALRAAVDSIAERLLPILAGPGRSSNHSTDKPRD